jgi:hypothetical protein
MSEWNPQTEVAVLKQTLAELIARVEKLERASLPVQYYPYGPYFGVNVPTHWTPFKVDAVAYSTELEGTWTESDFDSEAAQKAFFERGE